MLKVVGVIGYKNSGKTTLIHALARELTGRGYEVSVIKHSSHHMDLPEKDTTTLREAVKQVGFISPQESAVFWNKSLSLENMIPYLEADIVLVEGWKGGKTFPKIVCLREGLDDDGPDPVKDLFDGLAICAVGPAGQVDGLAVPHFERDEVGMIADLVAEKAFKLPNLDCGSCGRETCYDLAREIVAGSGSVEDCGALQPTTEVKVDGQPMPMNPFIAEIVRSTILGMLSPLKGFKKGKVEIRF
ncbi:MAG: molybdopterin-guanine dinucleotide biosynthesis protein B [Anaerolineae bacterium]|nr:molybdopterin-guanine dinucleotide biosynthesis protein B [Anaerolineae bacterium]